MVKEIAEEIKFKNGFDVECPMIRFMDGRK